MDEDIFNMQVRKFLKQVGVNAQREIETAVRTALADGRIKGDESLPVKATISLQALGLSKDIEGTIDLA
jgi:hypothetical protein